MTARLAMLAALALLASSSARAEVFSYTDPASRMTILSNVGPVSASASAPARPARDGSQARPAAFPRVSAQRQKELDGGRLAILRDELASEQQALTRAREQRAGTDVLARHAANLAALTRELGAVGQ